MTEAELKRALAVTRLPVYRDAPGGPVKPPYLVYLLPKDTPIGSDCETVADWRRVRVELYTRRADRETERKVQDVLDTSGILYGAERVPITEQRLHMTVFEFEIIEVRDA